MGEAGRVQWEAGRQRRDFRGWVFGELELWSKDMRRFFLTCCKDIEAISIQQVAC